MKKSTETEKSSLNEMEALRKRVSELELYKIKSEQAEKKYRNIFENAVEGIFQATPDGHFISVNPSMARILLDILCFQQRPDSDSNKSNPSNIVNMFFTHILRNGSSGQNTYCRCENQGQ